MNWTPKEEIERKREERKKKRRGRKEKGEKRENTNTYGNTSHKGKERSTQESLQLTICALNDSYLFLISFFGTCLKFGQSS